MLAEKSSQAKEKQREAQDALGFSDSCKCCSLSIDALTSVSPPKPTSSAQMRAWTRTRPRRSTSWPICTRSYTVKNDDLPLNRKQKDALAQSFESQSFESPRSKEMQIPSIAWQWESPINKAEASIKVTR